MAKPIHPIKQLREQHELSQVEGCFSELPERSFYELCKQFNIEPANFYNRLSVYKENQKEFLLAKEA
jgi:hypothetical protein